jgi:hypothetical protein
MSLFIVLRMRQSSYGVLHPTWALRDGGVVERTAADSYNAT